MLDRRVVVFDLDGCILDSTEPILACHNAALAQFGLEPISRHDIARYIGPPLQDTVAGILAERGKSDDLVEPLVEAYRSRYLPTSVDLAVAYDGIPELLVELAREERLAVCTSKASVYAVPILEHLGLDRHFETITGPPLSPPEPKVDTLGRAIEALSPFDRASSVMIGDRHHDIEAARHHGLVPVGVTWGFGSRNELEEAGASVIVDTPVELAGTLGR